LLLAKCSELESLAAFLAFLAVLSFSFVLSFSLVFDLSFYFFSGSVFLAFFLGAELPYELTDSAFFSFFFFFALAIFLTISSLSLAANLLLGFPCLLEVLSFLLLDFFFFTADSALPELLLRLDAFSFFFFVT